MTARDPGRRRGAENISTVLREDTLHVRAFELLENAATRGAVREPYTKNRFERAFPVSHRCTARRGRH
jgi:hypothetical protein